MCILMYIQLATWLQRNELNARLPVSDQFQSNTFVSFLGNHILVYFFKVQQGALALSLQNCPSSGNSHPSLGNCSFSDPNIYSSTQVALIHPLPARADAKQARSQQHLPSAKLLTQRRGLVFLVSNLRLKHDTEMLVIVFAVSEGRCQ